MATIEARKGLDGQTKFRVKIRLKGYPPQSETFDRKTDAKRWAQETESAIRQGRHFGSSEARRRTVAEVIDRYIDEVLPRKPKSIDHQRSQLLWWKEQLGHSLLNQVTPSALAACKEKLSREITVRHRLRAPGTVNRYIAAMSHVLSVASREWEWVAENPMRKVSKAKEPRGRTRYLSEQELSALIAWCRRSENDGLAAAVTLAAATGMRRSEILGLRWSQVNMVEGFIHLFETKNGGERMVPLGPTALQALAERAKIRRIDTDLVFPGRGQGAACKSVDIRKAWQTALKRAGIADFRFHDLRHTAASHLAMGRATLGEIAEVLGHKTLSMVKRYSHFSSAHNKNVIVNLDERLFGPRHPIVEERSGV